MTREIKITLAVEIYINKSNNFNFIYKLKRFYYKLY